MSADSRPAIAPERLARMLAERRVQVVDLRPEAQWRQARVASSRNIAPDQLATEAFTLDRGLPLVLYGGDDDEAADAVEAFRAAGMTAFALDGGFDAWVAAGLPVARDAAGPAVAATPPG